MPQSFTYPTRMQAERQAYALTTNAEKGVSYVVRIAALGRSHHLWEVVKCDTRR